MFRLPEVPGRFGKWGMTVMDSWNSTPNSSGERKIPRAGNGVQPDEPNAPPVDPEDQNRSGCRRRGNRNCQQLDRVGPGWPLLFEHQPRPTDSVNYRWGTAGLAGQRQGCLHPLPFCPVRPKNAMSK